MKIAYFIYWMDGLESGVMKKITTQIEYWKQEGNDVILYVYSSKGSKIDIEINHKHIKTPFKIIVITFNNKVEKLFNSFKVFKVIDEYKPDLIYMRESMYYPGIYKLNKKYPSIIELNSIVFNEVPVKSLNYIYNRLFYIKKFKHLKAIIAVTNEIAFNVYLRKVKAPKYIIANAINLNKIKPLPIPNAKPNNQIDLVFIGTANQIWHGIDKIIKLAILKPEWNFHIIGEKIKNKTPPNLLSYGNLNKNEYINIFKNADIAIGTLALHRKKMDEACPLKTREYLAYGLPVIIGYKDVDFTNDEDFLCQLPNAENNVSENIKKIEGFVKKWKGKRVPKEQIKHLDITEKEKIRLNIFKKFI